MRTSFCLGLLAAALLLPSIAAADDTGWYMGFGAGKTTASTAPGGLSLLNSPGLSVPFNDPTLAFTNSSSLSATSNEVEMGYWFNSYVGLQLSYVDMGTYSNGTHVQDSLPNICYGSSCTSDFSDTSKISVHGMNLALTGRLPLPDEFELLGRIGWFYGQAVYDESTAGIKSLMVSGGSSLDDSGQDLGVGLGWRFASHWGVQLWWDKYNLTESYILGNSTFGLYNQFDVRGYSLSVQYHF